MPPTRDPITGKPRRNPNGSPSKGCCCEEVDCAALNDAFFHTGLDMPLSGSVIDPADTDSPYLFSSYFDPVDGDTDWDMALTFSLGSGVVIGIPPDPGTNNWKWYDKKLGGSTVINFYEDDTILTGLPGFTPLGTCVYELVLTWIGPPIGLPPVFHGLKYTTMSTWKGRYLNTGQAPTDGDSSMTWHHLDVI